MKFLSLALIAAFAMTLGTSTPVAAQQGDLFQRLMILLNDAGRGGASKRLGHDDDDDGCRRARGGCHDNDDDDDGARGSRNDNDDDDDGSRGGNDNDDDD